MSSYTRPGGLTADLNFSGVEYTRPLGNKASFGKADAQIVAAFSVGDVGEVGSPIVRKQYERIDPVGPDLLSFGWATVRDPEKYTRPYGLAANFVATGQAYVRPDGLVADFGPRSLTPTIYPAGYDASLFGTHEVWNYSSHVTAGAIPPTNGYGKPSVWLYTRYLLPPGAHTQSFGTQWASHWLRYLLAVGAGDRLSSGTQWASHSPRSLLPPGVDGFMMLESHAVGGTQGIFAEGTEMTQWGTRIIPEGQVAYPVGFAGEVGKPDVQLYKRFVAPRAFAANPDDLRFGRQDVWNLRQYVQQDYDPNDDLNPPPFGRWTGIENRNKEPVPVGWLSERIGYQFAWNKASAVLPGGVMPPADLPTYKAGSVTHWQRSLSPGGVDSFASERWHVAHNNADLVHPHGATQLDFGVHKLENRSRQYEKVGNFDSAEVGAPFVADAIRELTFESRYGVEPPPIPLPDVRLHTRYLEYVSARDISGAGSPVLDIRWTYITPRWAFHPPAWIGDPALRNVTPELRTGGMNHEEFGDALIRTQWRRIETTEGDMTQWGRPIVRDRRQWAEFVTVGTPPAMLPGPKVTKIGGLPEAQTMAPVGIAPANGAEQVPKPHMRILFSYPKGLDSMELGNAVVTANSVRVEPGYGATSFGQPGVTQLRRVLSVAPFREDMVFQPSKPSLSPHTIYSVVEAPQQAKDNHPLTHGSYHYVGYGGATPKDVGTPAVTNRSRSIKPVGFSYFEYLEWPRPRAENAKRYVSVDGLNSFKRGIPTIPGPQEVRVFDQGFQDAIGRPTVAPPPYVGPITLMPDGVSPPAIPFCDVDFRQRERATDGWDSMSMGGSVFNDTPYQWRGLHVGAPMPTIPGGFLAESVGTPWVSLAVRDVSVNGWQSHRSEYDIDNFEQRMRVEKTPRHRPAQTISVQGVASLPEGTPDIRPSAHYIRPDGNAEQYRKGAPQ